jgi:hypothetical protein
LSLYNFDEQLTGSAIVPDLVEFDESPVPSIISKLASNFICCAKPEFGKPEFSLPDS